MIELCSLWNGKGLAPGGAIRGNLGRFVLRVRERNSKEFDRQSRELPAVFHEKPYLSPVARLAERQCVGQDLGVCVFLVPNAHAPMLLSESRPDSHRVVFGQSSRIKGSSLNPQNDPWWQTCVPANDQLIPLDSRDNLGRNKRGLSRRSPRSANEFREVGPSDKLPPIGWQGREHQWRRKQEQAEQAGGCEPLAPT